MLTRIGASSTVFSVLDTLLLKPLPFRDPGSLVWIANRTKMDGDLSGATVQVGRMLDFRQRNKSFSDVAGYFAFYGVGDVTADLCRDHPELATELAEHVRMLQQMNALLQPTDERADQFAFCVTLYEAVYGERPYDIVAGAIPTEASTMSIATLATLPRVARTMPRGSTVPKWIQRAIARGGYVAPRVFFADEPTAVAAGYRPCAICLPAAYAAWKSGRAG